MQTWWEQSASTAELESLRKGDEALFTELVVGLTPVLMRMARSYTPTDAAAQDAVQDTWLTVVDSLDGFAGRSSLKTWVCGVLVHKARRVGVREARSLPFSSVWGRDDDARFADRHDDAPTGTWKSPPMRWDLAPEERLAAGELAKIVEMAIADLPLRQRELITARDVVGMDAAEAAAVLGLSAGNQRVLLHRARAKVRAAVESYATDVLAPDDRKSP